MMFLAFLLVGAHALSCLNEFSEPVDWWITLKMPKIAGVYPEGNSYFYCDATNDCRSLMRGRSTITSTDAPLLATVAQYATQPLQLYWNDQVHDGRVMYDHAHSKGLMAGSDNGSAILINHSMPKFPAFDDNGELLLEYPSNALTYGQHIFCVTTTLRDLENVAVQYINAEVNVFTSTFNINAGLPNLQALAGQRYTTPRRVLFEEQSFHSRGGLAMTLFSKQPSQVVDFYASIVAPALGVGFSVETWGNGQGGLEDADCSSPNTFSTLQVTTPDTSYSYTKDHSKYAVSLSSSYVCFSDMNRQTSQHKRGGTAICFKHQGVWSTLDATFTERQEC